MKPKTNPELFTQLEDYLVTLLNKEVATVTLKSTDIVSSVIITILLITLSLIGCIVLLLGVALLIGNAVKNYMLGCVTVALFFFYILIILTIYINPVAWFRNKLTSLLYNQKNKQ